MGTSVHSSARLLAVVAAAGLVTGDSAARDVVVYHEAGRFAGWPANNGAWNWGDEIVVGFSLGFFKANASGHSIDRDRESRPVLARSLDGGETWRLEQPDGLARREVEPLTEPIRFDDPNFAMRVDGGRFRVTYDRGRTWRGPYDLSGGFPFRLTSRTDYLVTGGHGCLVFLSGEQPEVSAGDHHDRAFCARTTDGGMTFRFVSWMTGDPLTARSVMPTTVRTGPDELVSVLRRREGDRCWIDAYGSDGLGTAWHALGRVADVPGDNGNPPSLARLPDGRLCVAYGTRADPYGISATVSVDGGRTWCDPIVLRSDGRNWDLGYPRTVVRADGALVTVYYFTTAERPEQHIAATIWKPPSR